MAAQYFLCFLIVPWLIHLPAANGLFLPPTKRPLRQIKGGVAIHRELPNTSPFTLQHSPACAPRLLPLNPTGVRPNYPGNPSVMYPPNSNGLDRLSPKTAQHENKDGKTRKHPDSAPFSLLPSSQQSDSSHHRRWYYATHPHFQAPLVSPAHLNLPAQNSKKRDFYGSPPTFQSPIVSHTWLPIQMNNRRFSFPPTYNKGKVSTSASPHSSPPAYNKGQVISSASPHSSPQTYTKGHVISPASPYSSPPAYNKGQVIFPASPHSSPPTCNEGQVISPVSPYSFPSAYNKGQVISPTSSHSSPPAYNKGQVISPISSHFSPPTYNKGQVISLASSHSFLPAYNKGQVISPASSYSSPLAYNKGQVICPASSHSSPRAYNKGHVITPTSLHSSPSANNKGQVISSTFSPHYVSIVVRKRKDSAPNINVPEINPAPSPVCWTSPKSKQNCAPLTYIEGPMNSPTLLHPSYEIPKIKIKHHASPHHKEGTTIISASPHPSVDISGSNMRLYAPTSYPRDSYQSPVSAPFSQSGAISSAPLLAPNRSPSYIIWQIYPPESSPSMPFKGSPQSTQALPPPPPNFVADCAPLTCQLPLTNPTLGSLCTCVLPIKVELRIGIALYKFFPLVSEFAKEIAFGILMKQSQVRIMGANSDPEDYEKTDVLIDLVPLGKSFKKSTVLLTSEKFWKKQVAVRASYFGEYDVLYVTYPGLPPSPPTGPAYLYGEAYASHSNASVIQPFAVDVRKKEKLSGSLTAIIVLSSVIVLFLIAGFAWLLLLRNSFPQNCQSSQPPLRKSSVSSSKISMSTSRCSAKVFTLAELERTTNRFDELRVIGEGGFGRVYQGILEDGTMVAVKVRKRDDRQGEREFLAEVEMLSRLHHRNLVKLMGICSEKNVYCLVYELIPNGSVESHLHGIHKETTPLDWNARMKIALGTARALAYLHEDSNPSVIHRDFKSSNILLEHDFTPRVSDFGLARTVSEEGREHISTQVMGTFGYLAPEYAMTGHLLAKSDVYSYGVVLLELLTGRKPVDMSQPPGRENLVAWTCLLLTNMEALQTIIDPALHSYPHDAVMKVAAIASICVQPQVSHRPLMSEVVQALRLVCEESEELRESESCNEEAEAKTSIVLSEERERNMAEADVLYGSSRITVDASDSFRRYSSSGPISNARSGFLWKRLRGFVSGSRSEHVFWSRARCNERWSQDL